MQTLLNLSWIPHFSSVINWSLRLGLGLLKQIKPIEQPWLAIVDHSIDVGTKKALVVLRVRLDVMSQRGGALGLADCECIGLRVSETVNGDTLAQELGEIFTQTGNPVGIIKDCDATLNKGVRLWSQASAAELAVIDDLSHVVATALKKQYESSDAYKQFTALVNGASQKLRQTAQAFLMPPKLRNKGRFMSIGRLAEWGRKILDVLVGQNDAHNVEMLQKLNAVLPDFAQASEFIKDFANTTQIVSQVMNMLKHQGIEQKTYEHCTALSAQLPDEGEVKHSLNNWLDKHIAIQQRLSDSPLPVSSDVIESLFGRFKNIIERSPQADMNRSVLIIPALCGNLSTAAISESLSTARHIDLQAWEAENIPYTMRKKRQTFFRNLKPKNGEPVP